MDVTMPEGASKRFRCKVPDGRGGWKNLTGYTVIGKLRATVGAAPVVTLSGSVDSADPTVAYVDLRASDTATRGGAVYKLELSAESGDLAHKAVVRVEITDV